MKKVNLRIAAFFLISPFIANAGEIVFDDMEHGFPWGNGWFAFNSWVGGGGIGPNFDTPPGGGNYSLETGWGSGGVPGYFGGFGRTSPIDLTGMTYFNFWINPDGFDGFGREQDYLLEINLQDDDNGDGAITLFQLDDDEFQYNCVVAATGPCAISGGGWQQISIPLSDFFDDNSFFQGGNGVLDPFPVSNGGNGQLINVVIAVISNNGADVTFRTDNWTFTYPEPVTIDIKPGSDPNCINLNGHGVIPVAVLSSETFDAASIDIGTLALGGLDVRVRGNKGPQCSLEDVDFDGLNDLICQFQDNPEYWDVGDDEASLTGELLDGTRIEGSDSICIVP